MHLFSKKRKGSLFKADIFEDMPSPKDGELLAIPLDNELWHPNIAVYANNRKTSATIVSKKTHTTNSELS